MNSVPIKIQLKDICDRSASVIILRYTENNFFCTSTSFLRVLNKCKKEKKIIVYQIWNRKTIGIIKKWNKYK